MSPFTPKTVLQIKKYPNRRFYDATRSRHVTLDELRQLIVGGNNLVITDSKTGEDLTNLVLAQIVLEKDPPKLDVFPAWAFHQLIRANQHVLRTTLDRFFGPLVEMLATGQKQFDAYVRGAMSGRLVSPMEWAEQMMQPFTRPAHGNGTVEPVAESPSGTEPTPTPSPDAGNPAPDAARDEVRELRRQVAELIQRVDTLTGKGARPTAKRRRR